MIPTLSSFYYGHTVNESNKYFNFKEGAGSELTGSLDVGLYTLTEYAAEIEKQINITGALVYTVSVNRTTRIITISSSGAFTILAGTGTNVTSSIWDMAGFNSSDTSSATSHAGNSASGSKFEPILWLQDFVGKDDWQSVLDGVRQEATSGEIEVVTFGRTKFMQFNLIMQSNNDVTDLGTSATGRDDLRTFMQYLITLAPIEINYDKNSPSTYDKIRLESTSESNVGLGYKLKEMYDRGLPDVYETGTLKFRVFEG